MKILYAIQSILFITLLFVGQIFQREQERLIEIFSRDGYEAGPYGNPSFNFAVLAGCCCCVLLFVAIRTIPRMQKAGYFLFLLGLGFGLFSGMMMASPRGISLRESLWAWSILTFIVLVWSVLVGKVIDQHPLRQKVGSRADILDDLG